MLLIHVYVCLFVRAYVCVRVSSIIIYTKHTKWLYYLPEIGQWTVLQRSVCLLFPSHCWPNADGTGLSHSRCRFVRPPPHVTVQLSQSPQDDQPPSISIIRYLNTYNTYFEQTPSLNTDGLNISNRKWVDTRIRVTYTLTLCHNDFSNSKDITEWVVFHDVPPHVMKLHISVCSSLPVQDRPKVEGVGLSHNLCLFLFPPPQVTEQELQDPHADQHPSEKTTVNANQLWVFHMNYV